MSPQARPRKWITAVWVATGIALGMTRGLAAQVPPPPPPEAIRLLDLLAQGSVTLADLKDVLHPVLAEKYGTKYNIGYILLEAIKRGALSKDEVAMAMESEGCPISTNIVGTQCGELARIIQRADKSAASAAGVSAVGPQAARATIEQARAEILQLGPKVAGSNETLRNRYAAALIQQGASPLRRAVELFCINSVDELDSEDDRKTVRALAGRHENPKDRDEAAVDRLRSGFGGALCTMYYDARPTPEMLAEVRAIPAEVIQRAMQVDRRYGVGGPLRHCSAITCGFDAWRKGTEPPNQWTAWKELLLCTGW